jgi:Tol biopolymer transport system component
LSHLWIVKIATGERRRVTETDAVQPSWSPHGQRIAYWAAAANNRVRDIWTVAANGGGPVAVTDDPAVDWDPVWAPDGKHLYFISDRSGSMNLWRVAIDERSGKALSSSEPINTPASFVEGLSVSADGKRLAFVSQINTANIQKVDFDPVVGRVTGAPVPVTRGTRLWGLPDPSPDGQWVAVQSFPQQDIFVSRSDGSGLRQLTNDPFIDQMPRWSPDGNRIAFFSNRTGNLQIWSVRPDGSDLRQVTAYHPTISVPTWSPDGSRMAGYLQASGKTLLFDPSKPWKDQSPEELPIDQGQTRCTVMSWSPDGRKLACAEDWTKGVFVYSLDAKKYERLTDSGGYPAWLGDNHRLLFSTQDGKLSLIDAHSKKSREVLSLLPEWVAGPRLSRDNRQIFFQRSGSESDIYMLTFK